MARQAPRRSCGRRISFPGTSRCGKLRATEYVSAALSHGAVSHSTKRPNNKKIKQQKDQKKQKGARSNDCQLCQTGGAAGAAFHLRSYVGSGCIGSVANILSLFCDTRVCDARDGSVAASCADGISGSQSIDQPRLRGRNASRQRRRVFRHSLCAAAHRRASSCATGSGRCLDRAAARNDPAVGVPTIGIAGSGGTCQQRRGLPLSQRLEPGAIDWRGCAPEAGDGLDPWRRLCRRIRRGNPI